MENKKIEIPYIVFDSQEELQAKDRLLIEKATEAMHNAYSPYSRFKVGAAVLLTNGTIVLGNNQENVAYPSGLCAERVAVFAASANYPKEKILAIAIVASSEEFEVKSSISPCGSCRQVILEYEKIAAQNIRILLAGAGGKTIVFEKAVDLLPLSFFEEQLKKD